MSITAHVPEVTDASFVDDVLKSELPVLVEFWATWCGPCRMVAPVLGELADEHADRWRVVRMDTDANPTTARDYQVMGVPMMVLFKGGAPVASVVGARAKQALWRAFESHL